VTQISIKDQIKKLVDLQKIDAEIYNVNTGLTEKPALIEELKGKFVVTYAGTMSWPQHHRFSL